MNKNDTVPAILNSGQMIVPRNMHIEYFIDSNDYVRAGHVPRPEEYEFNVEYLIRFIRFLSVNDLNLFIDFMGVKYASKD